MWSAIITWVGVGIHIIACFGLLVCAEGLETVEEVGYRYTWIVANRGLWTATWLCWACASVSLTVFALIWSRHLIRRGGSPAIVWTGCAVIALGLPFDLVGETTYINAPDLVVRPIMRLEHEFLRLEDLGGFITAIRTYTLVSVVTANGLYCVGGLMLSLVAYRLGWLTGPVAFLGFVMWVDGFVLSAAGLFYHRSTMIASGGLLMLLFIPWSTWVGYRMLPRLDPPQTPGV